MYELSHDTLVAPILKAKAQRLQSERLQQTQQQLLEIIAKRKKKIIRAAWLLTGPTIFVVSLIVLSYIAIKGEVAAGSWLEYLLGYVPLITVLLVTGFVFLIAPAALLGFIYEFIVGESILSKLRKRAGNPAKQKGLRTRIGRWLS
jgi:hypothetical protein